MDQEGFWPEGTQGRCRGIVASKRKLIDGLGVEWDPTWERVKEGSKAWIDKHGEEEEERGQRGFSITMGLGAGPGSFFFVSFLFLRSSRG